MNIWKKFAWALAFAVLAAPAFAQTKKELKAEVERLTTANNVLQQQNGQLQLQTRKIADDYRKAQSEAARLRSDSANMAADYQALRSEYVSFQQQAAQAAAAASASPASSGGSYVDPADTRPCAISQAKLQAGHSYHIDNLSPLNTSGWGVQVYSSDNLCNAMEKAEEFSAYYTMYKTYIRVKTVGNKRVFSVVYGSLRDHEQAKTYCELFKKNARPQDRGGAFLVQH
jgi:hypothetical protein